jgi:hypothetical protein
MNERLSLTKLEFFDRVADVNRRRFVADLYENGFYVALPKNDQEDIYEAILFEDIEKDDIICDFVVHGHDVYFEIYDDFFKLKDVDIQKAVWYTLLYRASAYAGRQGMITLQPHSPSAMSEIICEELATFEISNQKDLIDFIEYQYSWR